MTTMTTITPSANPIDYIFDEWQPILAEWQNAEQVPDANMYLRLAQRCGAPILELGIGDGRVAAVVRPEYGVDLSPVMLRKCRERMGNHGPTLLLADFKDYTLPEPVSFTYAPLNALNHVRFSDRQAVWRNVLRNTTPRGYFAFDSRVPVKGTSDSYNKVPLLNARATTRVITQTATLVDRETQELRLDTSIEMLDEDGYVTTKRYLPPMPFYDIEPGQFEALASDTGWHACERWGGFKQEPWVETSRIQVWPLRRP